MPAEVIDIADFIQGYLESQLPSGSDIEVLRTWDVEEDLGIINDKQLRIYPTGYLNDGPADRNNSSYYDCTVSVIYRERYEAREAIPDSWIDEKVTYVEEVFNLLTNDKFQYGTDQESWSQSASVVTLYNRQILRESKVFWSEIELTFRKIKES